MKSWDGFANGAGAVRLMFPDDTDIPVRAVPWTCPYAHGRATQRQDLPGVGCDGAVQGIGAGRMTVDEFFVELGEVDVEWFILPSGRIRGWRSGCCPISALAVGGPIPSHRYRSVGMELGLRYSVTCNVANAADQLSGTRTQRSYRKRLLKACGLS